MLLLRPLASPNMAGHTILFAYRQDPRPKSWSQTVFGVMQCIATAESQISEVLHCAGRLVQHQADLAVLAAQITVVNKP